MRYSALSSIVAVVASVGSNALNVPQSVTSSTIQAVNVPQSVTSSTIQTVAAYTTVTEGSTTGPAGVTTPPYASPTSFPPGTGGGPTVPQSCIVFITTSAAGPVPTGATTSSSSGPVISTTVRLQQENWKSASSVTTYAPGVTTYAPGPSPYASVSTTIYATVYPSLSGHVTQYPSGVVSAIPICGDGPQTRPYASGTTSTTSPSPTNSGSGLAQNLNTGDKQTGSATAVNGALASFALSIAAGLGLVVAL